MATNASTKTFETALPDDNRNRKIGQPGNQFNRLIDWLKGLEETDKSTRVHAVLTTDANAPDFVPLAYSHPVVKIGNIEGYQRGDGSVVLFDNV